MLNPSNTRETAAQLFRWAASTQYNAGEELKITANAAAKKSMAQAGTISDSHCPRLSFTLLYVERHKNFWDVLSNLTTPKVSAPAQVNVTYAAPKIKAEVKDEKEKRQEKSAAMVAVLGGIVLAGAAFTLGILLPKVQAESANLRKTKTMQKLAEKFTITTGINDVSGTTTDALGRLVYAQLEIDEKRYSRIRNYLIATSALLIGGGLMCAGGITMVPWMMAAGKISAVAGVVLGLFNFIYGWNDKTHIEKNLKSIVRDAKLLLEGLNSFITFPTRSSPQPQQTDDTHGFSFIDAVTRNTFQEVHKNGGGMTSSTDLSKTPHSQQAPTMGVPAEPIKLGYEPNQPLYSDEELKRLGAQTPVMGTVVGADGESVNREEY